MFAIWAELMPPVATPITSAVPDPDVARDAPVTETNDVTSYQAAAKLVPLQDEAADCLPVVGFEIRRVGCVPDGL